MSVQDRSPRDGSDRLVERPPLPTASKVVLGVLLGACIVVPLLVPLYAQETPDLGGMPFYFWFQFALIPVVSVLTFICFAIVSRHENRGGKP